MSASVVAVLPRNWATPPVYARFSVQLGKMLDEKRITGTHLGPYLRNVDVQWSHVNTVDLPEMDFSDQDRQQYSLRTGDLLVCEGGEVGRTAIWGGALAECYFQKAVHRLRPITESDEPRFFRYFMRMAVDSGVFAQTTASTIQHLTAETLRVVRYPAPPIEQQRAIADYLDLETARLDALVAAKERVLGLLAEKRRALITRAVTRGLPAEAAAKAGLDPSAPLCDSGIPWLAEIPAHWELWKVGHLAIVGNGSTPNRDNADYWAEGTVPWLNSSVVNQEEVTAADQFITETALRECHLPIVKPGSVLVGITGQGKTRGTAVVLSFAATINQHLAYITPNVGIADTWFLRWVLFAAYDFLRSISDDAGGTKGALTCEEVTGIRVPLPPVSEQHAIVGHIAAEIAKLDAIRAATERTIDLLKERRAALIAAAVTGQIDVGSGRYYTDDAASQKEPERRQ